MELEHALRVANSAMFAHISRRLSEVETAILLGSMQGHTYEQIAEASGYAVSYVKRDVGPKLWKLLGQALGEEISKTNFQAALQQYWHKSLIATTQTQVLEEKSRPGRVDAQDKGFSDSPAARSPAPVPFSNSAPQQPRTDWGEVVSISGFSGRMTELSTLTQWIVADRCRLVALLGMGGIGKTSLSVKLTNQILVASQLQGRVEFEYVIWRSLRNAPPLDALLSDLVLFLSNQQDPRADLERLIYYLRTCRCLLILDNLETILQPGQLEEYCPGYDGYGDLLRLIGETAHQSCLILTSREKPPELGAMEGADLPVRVFKLTGLHPQGAETLLTAKGLSGVSAAKQKLIQTYGGNPLALKIVATSIHDLFDGDIATFLAQETALFNGIRKLLDQHFSRLSTLERVVMYWLAINREWTTVAELVEDIVPAISKADLLETLKSLNGRSLIEKHAGSYTQQPVVMEYVTDSLTERIAVELASTKLSLFISYALMKTTVKDYVRASQDRLILGAIATRLLKAFGSLNAIEQQLQTILTQLRFPPLSNAQLSHSSYAAGNLINLCRHLQIDLTGYDFSHLTVWHANLQKATLHRVNLAHSDLTKSVFTQSFGGILSVDFSPDGTLLATGDVNGEVCLWQIADGKKRLACIGHANWVWSVAFSPNGQLLASSGDDHTVRLWDVQTGQCLKILRDCTNWVRTTVFSPNGQLLASGSHDKTIRLWNVQTGQCLMSLRGHTAEVWSVSFSADGQRLASAGDDRTIRIWDVNTGQCLTLLQGHTDSVWSVAFSPNRDIPASGSNDQTIKIWDTNLGQCLHSLQGSATQIFCVSFSADGQCLASGGDDRAIRVWDVDTGQCLKLLQGHTDSIWSVAFSPDSQRLASGGNDQTTKIWDIHHGHCLRTLQGYTNQVFSVAFSSDGQLIVSGHSDHRVRVWNWHTGQVLKTLQGHTSWVWSASFSPDSEAIASGSGDQTIKLWNGDTGELLQTLQRCGWVWSVVFSPGGQTIASGHGDCTVKLWDRTTGQSLKTLYGHTGWVRSVGFSPNGETLASGGGDHTVRLWNRRNGECSAILQGHGGSIRSVVFSPDGQTIASGSEDKTIRLWNWNTAQPLSVLQGHTNSIRSVDFSPDGKLLASGSEDHTIRLWDSHTGECMGLLQGHSSQVLAIAFSPDGCLLASGSEDETIRLWHVNTGECLKTLRSDRPYEGMNITGIFGITDAQKETLKALGGCRNS